MSDNLPEKTKTKKEDLVPVVDNGEFANWLDTNRFNQLWRIANVFADGGNMVPDHFNGQPAACMIAVQMAFRLQVDPMMFLQKSYVVHGRPGIEATLAISLCNTHGPFTGPIQYKLEGEPGDDNCVCTAYATHKVTNEVCEMPLDWETVKAEGWVGKSGSKWKTMPRLMLMYRSAMWLIRAFCPEVILGMHSLDELRDSGEVIDVTPIDDTHAKNKAISPDTLTKVIDDMTDTPQEQPGAEETGSEGEEQSSLIEEEGWLPSEEILALYKQMKIPPAKANKKIINFMAKDGLTSGKEIDDRLEELGVTKDADKWEAFCVKAKI